MAEDNTLRFQRANFVVQDIERSLTFYRDVLGFTVAFIKESPGRLLFLPGVRNRPLEQHAVCGIEYC